MKFSKERKQYLKRRIKFLRERGLSYKEIAKRLQVSEGWIYRNKPVEKTALFFRQGSARSTPETRKIALRLLRFLPVNLVSWAFGVEPKTISRWRENETG